MPCLRALRSTVVILASGARMPPRSSAGTFSRTKPLPTGSACLVRFDVWLVRNITGRHRNNTIVHSANGGISTFSSIPPIFLNNIVAFNDHYGIHNQPYSQPIMGYNNLYGNPGYNIVNCWDLGPGALSVDPLFSADFSLNSGSPCINAGNPDPLYNDPDGSRTIWERFRSAT